MAAADDIHSPEVIDICQETEGKSQPSGSVSQSYCPSTVESAPTTPFQMLSVKLDKLPLLESLREKVEKNYCVQIREDMCLSSDGKSPSDMQWISILGSKGDCKDAGTYIGALCNPAEWTVYDYAPTLSEVFDEDTCQKIEDKSHAVLIRDGDCRLIIQGSDQLHVLLALSIVEDIVARFETNVSESSQLNSSAMLDNVLKRAYSNDGEVEDGFDWSTMPEEVKRAVLVSLLDSDVSETTVVDIVNVTDEEAETQETVPVEVHTADVSSSVGSADAAATANGSNTSSVTTANKVVDSPVKLDFSDPAIQPLIKLALSKDYSREEIENVLSNNSQWKESEFLRSLHTNRRIQSLSARSHQPSASSMEAASVEDTARHETHMDVDVLNTEASVAAGDDSVILLMSDHEMESFDEDDDKNLDVEKDSRLVPLAEQSVLPSDQAQITTAGESGAVSGRRRKKKKRNKRKILNLPNRTVPQEEKAPVVLKTGNEINDLDCISLIPSAALSATVDVSVLCVSEESNSDSDILEVPLNDCIMMPVVGRKQQCQLDRQKEARSRSPVVHLRSTSDNTYKNDSCSNPRQLDGFTASALSSVPATAAGFQRSAQTVSDPGSLRYIVIDGSNVAMSHGNGRVFSCRGIKLVIDFFKQRGHSKVVALVPQWRRQAPTVDRPISDQDLLETLKEQGTLTFTPSRRIGNRNISCYDDRFMLDLAIQTEGVIVTNDNYRDLYGEKFQYRVVIENRLLPYSLVDDIFMIPEDPLGQYGPRIDEFLRMPSSCSSGQPRALSSLTSGYSQAGSSSSLLGNPRPTGLRGISHGQTRPVAPLETTRFPRASPLLANQRQQQPQMQQWQVRQQRLPQWQHPAPHRQLWPPPSQTATAVHNTCQNDSASGAKSGNASTVMAGSRGRGGQHGAARSSAPTLGLGPRSFEKTHEIQKQLLDVFPNNAKQVDSILEKYRYVYSVDELCLKVSEIVPL